MSTELAEAYVSLVVETSKVPAQVKQAFGQADPEAARAGQRHGSLFADSFGKAFKVGAAGAAAAGIGAAGAALTKGFQRLTAIDDAQGKLKALGNSAQQVSSIMDSAMDSVKGTAYSLGDAATIAASAVAAGVKPGQDLTKYLKLTADAAAVAGTNLSDMGLIINQVHTGQMAYTDDLNQLADRGLPIYQWLADTMGVAASQVKKLASEGQISSEKFEQAISTHIGGAALQMGDTFSGSVKNVEAALGRLGAAALEPTFKRLQGGANDSTGAIDKLTPKVAELGKALDNKIFNDWGPKLKKGFEDLKKDSAAQKFITDIKSSIEDIGHAAREDAPAVASLIASLSKGVGQAGALGLSVGIKAVSASLQAVSPILKTVSDLMSKNQTVVTALVTGYLALKSVNTIQGYLEPFAASVRKVGTDMEAAGGKAAYFGGKIGSALGKAALGGAVVGLSALSQKTDEFGQKTDGAQAAGYGLNILMGTMTGSMLGPWGAAFGGLAGAGLSLVQMFNQNSEAAKRFDDTMKSQLDTMDKLTGKQTQATIESTAKNLGSRVDQAQQFGINRNDYIRASAGVAEASRKQINDALLGNITSNSQVQYWAKLNGMSTDDFGKALQGQQDYVAKVKKGASELDMVRDRLKDDPVTQSSVDLARAMNTQSEATTKASQSAQQLIKDTHDQYQANDALKSKVQELGGTIAKVPQKNVVEITTPPGADPEAFRQKIDGLHLGLTELEADNKTIKVVLDDSEAQKGITRIENQQIKPKNMVINAILGDTSAIDQLQARSGSVNQLWPGATPDVLHRADGGPGPVKGGGGRTSDSVPAMLSTDEHVWSGAETAAVGGHGAMASLRSMALRGKLRFAQGGTPFGISEAISAAQDMEGHPYLWGGVGPERFDCSGFIGFLQQVAMGLGRVAKRLYTTNTILDGSSMAGLKPGTGPSGTLFQVGVSQEHMAATIDGLNVESGGAAGTSGIGAGRAGAFDSQFPNKFYLPNELIAGINNLSKGGKLVEWTAQDERDLQRLIIGVDEAKQNRDKVYKNPKSTATDKRKADFDVQDAQAKVVEKQKDKDKQGTIEGGTRVAPQAPALQKRYSDEDETRVRAQQKLEQANIQRNQVYDNPESTDADKAAADADWQDAYDEAADPSSDGKKPTSVKDVLTNFASTITGVAFDAFKAQLPDQVSGSYWWDVADKGIEAANYGKKNSGGNSIADLLGNIPTFAESAFRNQLGYDPRNVPDWAKKIAPPGTKLKVFDTGGWLMPGEAGINLSKTPEPIFNSPAQLQAFAGSQLQNAQGGPGGGLTEADVERIMRMRPEYHIHTQDVNGAVQAVRVEQKRQAMGFYRR